MKSLATFVLALAIVATANAQEWTPSFGANYAFTLPTGGMKENVRFGNGAALNVMFEAPSHRLAAGLELNFSGYGHSKSEQDYEFPDGTVAPMNVIVNNTFTNLMATTRLYLLVDGPVRPYATVKAGYSFFRTRLVIEDPNLEDSCKPVESDLLSHDGTFVYSAGGGVRIDAGWIFKSQPRGRWYIDVSSSMTQGGRVNYMNEDAPDPTATHNMSTRSKEVEAEFINTQTQVVHSHHVGYMYNSFVQMMDFRLGVTFNIGY